jgi:CRISPR-associated endonuclease/helicase Cas3
MVDELWAHSRNGRGVRHGLDDHLRGTAELSRLFGEAFGAGDLTGYLGLVHDVGKGGCAWQQGLLSVDGTRRPVGTDHKGCGTWLANQIAGPFAMCVDGHHGGLPALERLKNQLLAATPAMISEWEQTAARVAVAVPGVIAGEASLVPAWVGDAWEEDRLAVELLMRMAFSALVDADFLDTEAHFSCARVRGRHSYARYWRPIGGRSRRSYGSQHRCREALHVRVSSEALPFARGIPAPVRRE